MNKKNSPCSIRDLAGYVGLSTCTVSKVLNNRPGFKILNSTRDRVLQAARELNYVPNINAKRLFERKSGVIALVVPSATEGDKVFADTHFVNLMSGMENALTECGYSLLLKFNDKKLKSEGKYLELVRAGTVDGLLIWGAHRSDSRCYRALAEYNVPHIFITSLPAREAEVPPFHFVRSDYAGSAETMTRHLLDHGCRKLLYLAGFEDSSVVETMTAGIRAAIPDHVELTTSYGTFSRQEAFERARRLFAGNADYDGIIAVSSRAAVGITDALREQGIPEGRIRIAVLDSAARTPVSGECGAVVTQDEEIGRAAMAGIVALIERKIETIQQTIKPKLFFDNVDTEPNSQRIHNQPGRNVK